MKSRLTLLPCIKPLSPILFIVALGVIIEYVFNVTCGIQPKKLMVQIT